MYPTEIVEAVFGRWQPLVERALCVATELGQRFAAFCQCLYEHYVSITGLGLLGL